MVLGFSLVFIILRKFAWGPILKMLREREQSIDDSLKAAVQAREEMARLKTDHEAMMQEARAERDKMMGEARQIREQMINKAREDAQAESTKLLEQTRKLIEGEKVAAINEIRGQVAVLSVEIAEKILRHELQDRSAQEKLIKDQISDMKLN
jgi:F-type H+-transporting ATPase subunit b